MLGAEGKCSNDDNSVAYDLFEIMVSIPPSIGRGAISTIDMLYA